jgi:hypothetical protein
MCVYVRTLKEIMCNNEHTYVQKLHEQLNLLYVPRFVFVSFKSALKMLVKLTTVRCVYVRTLKEIMCNNEHTDDDLNERKR